MRLLGTMQGGYNVAALVEGQVMESWANAEWFTSREPFKEKITVTVFKVTGETNTDDLTSAGRLVAAGHPLHALAMLKKRARPRGIRLRGLKEQGFPLAYVGDVVGTGSSRKSSTKLWYMGARASFAVRRTRR